MNLSDYLKNRNKQLHDYNNESVRGFLSEMDLKKFEDDIKKTFKSYIDNLNESMKSISFKIQLNHKEKCFVKCGEAYETYKPDLDTLGNYLESHLNVSNLGNFKVKKIEVKDEGNFYHKDCEILVSLKLLEDDL